jgi:hypothetical protein
MEVLSLPMFAELMVSQAELVAQLIQCWADRTLG